MLGRLTIIGIGATACGLFLYEGLDYHYVAPMSLSNTDTKEHVAMPITATNTLDYSMYQKILSDYVEDGRVKYVPLRKSMMRDKRKDSLFIKWLHVLSQVGPNSTPNLCIDEDEALKYYINAYNALAIYGVLHHSFYYKHNHYLISSVMDVKSRVNVKNGWGFFKAAMYALDGDRSVSLHHLEHKIIRPQFKDARVHCAINCASVGCPKLQSYVIEVGHLDYLSAEFVNDTRNVNVDKVDKKLHLSQIFKWYKQDFEEFYKTEKSQNVDPQFENHKMLYFVYKYSDEELRKDILSAMEEGYKIEWNPYDWKLNNYAQPLHKL